MTSIVKYLVVFVLCLVNLGSRGYAQAVSRPSHELDAAMTCAPMQTDFVFRCRVKIVHRPTNAPLCVHRGSISFAMLSMPTTQTTQPAVQSIDLKTDINGEMKDMDVRLETPGIWSVAIKAGDDVIRKSIEVRVGSIHVR